MVPFIYLYGQGDCAQQWFVASSRHREAENGYMVICVIAMTIMLMETMTTSVLLMITMSVRHSISMLVMMNPSDAAMAT